MSVRKVFGMHGLLRIALILLVFLTGCGMTVSSATVGTDGIDEQTSDEAQPGQPISTIADSDGDGVSDDADACAETPPRQQVDRVGCSPGQIDSDGDGFSDEDETSFVPRTNPFDPSDNPNNIRDADGDSCSDYDESNFAGFCDNDPNTPIDSDGDGVVDTLEIEIGTDPDAIDTDGDGLADGEELDLGFDPLAADGDGDGLNDFDELAIGTSVRFADSDFDGLLDGEEVHIHGTNPLLADTDSDGMNDGLELNDFFGSDPLNPDTDGDGFLDGEENDFGLELLAFNPTGTILEVYCPDYIVAQSGAIVGVFEISPFAFLPDGFSSGFRQGDTVAFHSEGIPGAPIGPIRFNLRTGEIGFAHWEGPRSTLPGGRIVGAQTANFGVGIDIVLDTGFTWTINLFEVNELDDWFIGDDVIIIGNVPGIGERMLNVDACEAVLAGNRRRTS